MAIRIKLIPPLVFIIFFIWLMMPVEKDNTYLPALTGHVNEKNTSLIYTIPSSFETLDPARARSDFSALVISQVFEGLVQYCPDTKKIKPCLAKKWNQSHNGLVWTFYLRQGVTFQDGTPLNAEAVKHSIERQQLNMHREMIYAKFVYGPLKNIEIIDEYTIKFTLKYPYPSFLYNLAMPFSAPVVSPAAVEKYGGEFWQHPSGTGPYILEKYDKNTLTLKANPTYWKNS